MDRQRTSPFRAGVSTATFPGTQYRFFCGRIGVLLAFLFIATGSMAQQAATAYPQNYFRNPLDIPIFLAGNFGECRPGHFHSGMDIKTLGKEGQPVHAAADGYISRIKMEPGGFGHALYITHPNGYTTLYAHLNDFAPAMQKYVEKEQYAKKRWDVYLPLSPTQFPVKKGQLIAWSGNTGGSTAPHLHFEIRDTKTEHPLNAELFGLPLTDNIAPVPTEVVLYKGNVYVSKPLFVGLEKYGEVYTAVKTDDSTSPVKSDTITVTSAATGVGIVVNDFMDGSENTLAFHTAKVFMDDQYQSQITLDNIGYDESRYVNAYEDYATKQLRNKAVQLLFQLPGNKLNIFTYLNPYRGRLDLTDKKVHKISILLTDDKENASTIIFYVNPSIIPPKEPESDCTEFTYSKPNVYKSEHVTFSLDERELYDDICFKFRAENAPDKCSDKFHLHFPFVPLHHYFSLKMKPNRIISPDLYTKVAAIYSDGKDESGNATLQTDDGWYEAAVRKFGTYWLAIDTIPPVIASLQRNNSNMAKAKQITFEVKDDMTSVRKYGGYLDGKWICFEQHSDLYFYKFDAHCPAGKHKLVFEAEDENGNKNSFELRFTR